MKPTPICKNCGSWQIVGEDTVTTWNGSQWVAMDDPHHFFCQDCETESKLCDYEDVEAVNSEQQARYFTNSNTPDLTEINESQVIEHAIAILESRLTAPQPEKITSSADTINYLKLQLMTEEREVFCVMILNNQHQLIQFSPLFYGTIDGASVYPREVVKEVLKHNGAAVIFAHNHPSGTPEPSHADRAITRKLRDALNLIDVRTLDHIIVAGADTTSMAERGEI